MAQGIPASGQPRVAVSPKTGLSTTLSPSGFDDVLDGVLTWIQDHEHEIQVTLKAFSVGNAAATFYRAWTHKLSHRQVVMMAGAAVLTAATELLKELDLA